MLKASWKSLWARKLSLLLSTVAIVLGTAFVAGSYTFTDMLQSAFTGITKGTVGDVNVQPKGFGSALGTGGGVDRAMTAADVAKVRSVDGVESAYGGILDYSTYVLDKNNKSMSLGGPGVGTNFIDAPAMGGQEGLVIKSGRAPKGDGEVMLDPQSFERAGYQFGDTVKIVTPGKAGTIEAKVVGTVLYGAKGTTAGATYAVFDSPFAQKIYLDGADAYQGIWVTAKPGTDAAQLADRIDRVLPAGFEAKTGQELADEADDMMAQSLQFITVFLLVFAAIALLVGSFLIFNTFSILVAQRGREMALMRAMGASRGQVTTSVIFEAVVMGLLGSLGGLVVGFGLAFGISKLFGSLGLDLSGTGMRLTPQALIATLIVGIVVTLIAALVPAVRAGRMPPVAAMSGDMMTGKTGLGWRAVGGGLILAVGVSVVLLALFRDELDNRMPLLGAGALLSVLGVAAVSPILGAPVIWLLGRINQAAFGTVGKLAELNSARNPRRTAVTASALMIGLALVTSLGTLAASTKASTHDAIKESLRGDFVVQNPTQMPFSPAVGDGMEKVSGVAAVHRVGFALAKIKQEDIYATVMRAEAFDKVIKQTMTQGSLEDFRGNAVLLHEDAAKERNLRPGDVIDVAFASTTVPVKVAGVFTTDAGTGLGSMILSADTTKTVGLRQMDTMITVDAADGADLGALREGLNRTIADMPMVTVADQEEFAKAQTASIDQLLYLLYALLGLAIVIAVFGIINTLGLSIIERTRELGLLRAVGVNKGQVRTMITLESVTLALLGSALGIGLGLLFGFALQRALAAEGLAQLVIPWAQIGISLLVALIVGVLAGLWPAARANKLDVLKAIATE